MDTWFPRLAVGFVFVTIALFAASFGWLALGPDDPPTWMWLLTIGVGFAGAVLCHIYNAAHGSLPPD